MKHMITLICTVLLLLTGCDRLKKSSPLIDAIKAKDKAKISTLIKQGANINGAVRDGTTPLIAAAATCQKDLIKQLVAKGAKINAYDSSKKPALMYAHYHCGGALQGFDIIHFLLEKGARAKDLKSNPGDRFAPLNEICLGGPKSLNLKAIQYYLSKGLISKKNWDNPLHCAARWGLTGYAKLMLKQGADVNAIDAKGQTPLHIACLPVNTAQDKLPLVSMLLAKGAKVETKDKKGKLPYYYLSPFATPKIAIALLKAGSPPDAPNQFWSKPPKQCRAHKDKKALGECLIAALTAIAAKKAAPAQPSPR